MVATCIAQIASQLGTRHEEDVMLGWRQWQHHCCCWLVYWLVGVFLDEEVGMS